LRTGFRLGFIARSHVARGCGLHEAMSIEERTGSAVRIGKGNRFGKRQAFVTGRQVRNRCGFDANSVWCYAMVTPLGEKGIYRQYQPFSFGSESRTNVMSDRLIECMRNISLSSTAIARLFSPLFCSDVKPSLILTIASAKISLLSGGSLFVTRTFGDGIFGLLGEIIARSNGLARHCGLSGCRGNIACGLLHRGWGICALAFTAGRGHGIRSRADDGGRRIGKSGDAVAI
jgi:hypothetical protein